VYVVHVLECMWFMYFGVMACTLPRLITVYKVFRPGEDGTYRDGCVDALDVGFVHEYFPCS
jgi:hypothetical protein